MNFRNGLRRVGTAFRDLKRDLKSTRWLRGLGWFLGTVWILGLFVTLLLVATGAKRLFSDSEACQADGSFNLDPRTYNMWSSSGFFQVTLGGGHLTFAGAKAVDIIWDVGIGRGGQLLLAIVSWREFARYLTICMEDKPVSYRLFRTIFIENDASLISTGRTIKSFIRQRRLRSKAAMVFMIATMLFILAFPTLMSAMSGYDSNVVSRVQDGDDNLVPFNKYARVVYVIHDGWRVGENGEYWIRDIESQYDPVLNSYNFCKDFAPPSHRSSTCNLVAHVSQYVEIHGLGGTRNESSQFMDTLIEPPVLNITAYKSEAKWLGGQNSPEPLDVTWVRGNKTFDRTYMELYGKCQNTGDYKWGFSLLQLIISMVLLLAWTVGIYIMWIYTHFTIASNNGHFEEVSGEYRAVLKLAAAMRIELDIEDTDLSVLREKQLKERVDKEIQGGTVFHAYPDTGLKTHSIRNGLKTWFKKDKWWFLAIFCTSLLYSIGYFFFPGLLYYWLFGVWAGQFWAFCIGTTVGSRLLIILLFSLVAGLTVAMMVAL